MILAPRLVFLSLYVYRFASYVGSGVASTGVAKEELLTHIETSALSSRDIALSQSVSRRRSPYRSCSTTSVKSTARRSADPRRYQPMRKKRGCPLPPPDSGSTAAVKTTKAVSRCRVLEPCRWSEPRHLQRGWIARRRQPHERAAPATQQGIYVNSTEAAPMSLAVCKRVSFTMPSVTGHGLEGA
jgi:hypothetical protein